MMKKIIVLAVFVTTVFVGYAQKVDNFVVGPYEVDYKGDGDFKFRLREHVDLYEFYGLQKDTIIQCAISKEQEVKHGIQVNVFMSLPRFSTKGASNTFGVSGGWKQRIGEITYLNVGALVGLSYGEYTIDGNNKPYNRKDVMLEVGIPLSIEFAKLNYSNASAYFGVGFTPTYYTTIKIDETANNGTKIDGKKDSGILVAPKVEFGGYIPLSNQILRVGVIGEYKLNCSGDDIYKDRTGRTFVGANIGLIF